jgi:hypothetical protein
VKGTYGLEAKVLIRLLGWLAGGAGALLMAPIAAGAEPGAAADAFGAAESVAGRAVASRVAAIDGAIDLFAPSLSDPSGQDPSGDPPPVARAPDPVLAGLASSFALPIQDLFRRQKDSIVDDLLDGLTVGPGLTLPLSSHHIGDSDTGDRLSGSSTVGLGLHYQPIGFWFAQITVQAYLEKTRRAPWNGDFTYGFGYDDYHPYTLSLTYSNYGDNRFRPLAGNPVSQLDRGAIALAWKAPLPGDLARPLLFDQTLAINCRVGFSASPRFDTAAGTVESWKTAGNLDCNYPFTHHWFVDLNALVYAHGQQPWDPDFTYSFGMADYRSDHFSIIYANYSGNRFPGRRTAPSTGHLGDGGLFINWNHGF